MAVDERGPWIEAFPGDDFLPACLLFAAVLIGLGFFFNAGDNAEFVVGRQKNPGTSTINSRIISQQEVMRMKHDSIVYQVVSA